MPMSRLSDSIYLGRSLDTNRHEENRPSLSGRRGGGYGFAPNIGAIDVDGKAKAEWISATPHVQMDVIPFLIQYPGFMDEFENSNEWIYTLKSMIETHCEQIDGINSEITVETEDVQLGPTGSMFMEAPVASRIARSSVTLTIPEKLGRTFGRFLTGYIRFGILDPYTQTALIGQVSAKARERFRKGLYLADFYSATVMYVSPDVTMSHVDDAWLHLGWFPKSAGEHTGGANKNSAKSAVKLSIPVAGFLVNGEHGINLLAQKLLDNVHIKNELPMAIMPFDEIDPALMTPEADANGYNRASEVKEGEEY